MTDTVALYLNYLLIRESVTPSLDVKQAVVDFFALELSKRLLIDLYAEGFIGDIEEYEVDYNDYHQEGSRYYKQDIVDKIGDVMSIISKQQQLCRTVSVPFLDKLKHLHTLDYQLHLLNQFNYGSRQAIVQNYLQTSYNTVFRALMPYFVFMLVTAVYTRHSDQSYLSDPLFLFKNRNYIDPYYNNYTSKHNKDVIVSDIESGHEGQGRTQLVSTIQSIVSQVGVDYKQMYGATKSSISYQQIDSDIRNGKFRSSEYSWGQQLENINNATSRLERSAAVTKILTFAHNRAPLIGIDTTSTVTPISERADFLFSVLSKQQFDSLNYTNERKTEHELKKMFS